MFFFENLMPQFCPFFSNFLICETPMGLDREMAKDKVVQNNEGYSYQPNFSGNEGLLPKREDGMIQK